MEERYLYPFNIRLCNPPPPTPLRLNGCVSRHPYDLGHSNRQGLFEAKQIKQHSDSFKDVY